MTSRRGRADLVTPECDAPVSEEETVVINLVTKRYLLLDGLPMSPIDPSLQKSVIAIIDSGIGADHPQIAGHVIEEVDFTGEGAEDEFGHGTVMALLALKSVFDIRREVPNEKWVELSIISLKVIGKDRQVHMLPLLAALKWLEGRKVDFVNLSLGFPGTYEKFTDLCDAIKRSNGPLFFAAAGNDGPSVTNYPASCELDSLISVGRVDEDGKPSSSSGKREIANTDIAMMVPWAKKLVDEGMEIARQGDLKKALTVFEQSIKDEPLPAAYYEVGLIFMRWKNYGAAEAAFHNAVNLQHGFPEALLHLGLSRYLQNDPKDARHFIEDALDLAPDNLSIRFNLALVLMDLKDYTGALEHLEFIEAREPNYRALKETFGEVKRRQGETR